MGASKVWYVVRCDKHGIKPKGQNYGEVIVAGPGPKDKMLKRSRTKCPYCENELLKQKLGEDTI